MTNSAIRSPSEHPAPQWLVSMAMVTQPGRGRLRRFLLLSDGAPAGPRSGAPAMAGIGATAAAVRAGTRAQRQ